MIFSFLSQKIGFGISCKLSPSFGDNLHEMPKPVSEKTNKEIFQNAVCYFPHHVKRHLSFIPVVYFKH